MKLLFSRKTWYLVLVISSALSMSSAFAALVGLDYSPLNFAAFATMGLAILYLAAEQDNSKPLRTNYFQAFLLGMFSYLFGGALGLVGAALTWPMLAYTEQKRGANLATQMRLLIAAEAIYAMFWLLASSGMERIYFYTNLFAVFKAVAHGWLAYTLLRNEKQAQG